jgi:hypothetical protein
LTYICSAFPKCDAYVGTHTNTKRPLGRLANAELRSWKVKAHAALDVLWKSKRFSRRRAYSMAADMLGKPIDETHIGMFDAQDCKDLIASIQKLPFNLQ